MASYSALIPTVSFGAFFFVLCKENLDRRTGAVTFDIQRQLFNLITMLTICYLVTCLALWFDNGSMLTSVICSWICTALYMGYMYVFENHVAAAMLKKRTEILAKAKEDQKKKQKNT